MLRQRWLSRGNIIGFGTSCGEEMRVRESCAHVRGAGDMGSGGSSSGWDVVIACDPRLRVR